MDALGTAETLTRNLLERATRRFRPARAIALADVQFPENYRALVSLQQTVRDVLNLQSIVDGGDAVDLRRMRRVSANAPADFDLRIYSAQEHILDDLMPQLHHLGLPALDQSQFVLSIGKDRRYIRSFRIRPAGLGLLERSRRHVLDALVALLSGEAEDDFLNSLVLRAGLNWREVSLLRAYCDYHVQLNGRIGRARLYEALLDKPDVTRLLFSYFETRFRPDRANPDSFDELGDIRQRLILAFDAVTDVTNDRIFRDVFNLIDATLRTNFYAREKERPGPIALKIDTLGVINAPTPKPWVEVFVHSPSMQGIHLRGAKVARGGIRWSDRAHDFRTEILDLMQTQMVKNALIVPQGAKGGFVLTSKPSSASRRQELGKAAYRAFISSLLDLTDNLGAAMEPRGNLVAYDDPDPYLVVAADKGTASWSDIANEISREHGFWLGDAFATGGSNGFHHKLLGITAKGAWVCVRRHFQELGRNIDDETFTVVGVGSMDGDVFGNGMLQSKNIRLLGAFSGEHIFIDPDPDPAVSYDERRRLFEKPLSSWQDYDVAKISAGGGVYRRDAKDIDLSPEARAWLQARNRLVDGEGLIRLLLTASADLLWLGGVGTYVKAATETDESVGDRMNDGARVNANQLRVRIVGEGANLGFTQRARVEFALKGGRIDTDAVDNSAGVDLSDHEVNLKILLRDPLHADQDGRKDVNTLLKSLTEEVCEAVLDNNYRQSLCLSLERERSVRDAPAFMELADRFEASGHLDRAADAFPTRKEAASRPEKGLTRPELSLLMAYAKLSLKRALLEQPDFLEEKWVSDFLLAYFPASIRSRYANEAASHPLAREIAATIVCNRIIDQAGARFLLFGDNLVPRLLIDAVGLYLAFDEILEGARWRNAVRRLDGRLNPSRQYDYLLQHEDALTYLCRWALERGHRLRPEKADVAEWRSFLQKFLSYLGVGAEAFMLNDGATEASRAAFFSRLRDFPFLVELAKSFGAEIGATAKLYDEIAALLELRQIAALSAGLAARDVWEVKLQAAIDERFRAAPARIAAIALRLGVDEPSLVFKMAGLSSQLMELQRLRGELLEEAPKTVAPFALFASELESLIDACEALQRAA